MCCVYCCQKNYYNWKVIFEFSKEKLETLDKFNVACILSNIANKIIILYSINFCNLCFISNYNIRLI